MLRTILKSKIQRARVTETQLYYPGSITIDSRLMQAADILEGEKVEVLNLSNGQRIETYAINGKRSSGVICLNGPAARSGYIGDEVIILSYGLVDEREADKLRPKIVLVDEQNRPQKTPHNSR
jgi:aspartate 1-decarboxylase